MTDLLFVTQNRDNSVLNKTITQGNNILHTPSLQHLYTRFLVRYGNFSFHKKLTSNWKLSDEDDRFPYNTLYNLLHLKINCDSPKTRQAMNNLDIKIDDLAIRPFEDYVIKNFFFQVLKWEKFIGY